MFEDSIFAALERVLSKYSDKNGEHRGANLKSFMRGFRGGRSKNRKDKMQSILTELWEQIRARGKPEGADLGRIVNRLRWS